MSEIDCLETVLRTNFCDEWDFKREKNSITLSRDTGDDLETIRVSQNDLWDVTVKIMNRKRQIFTPVSYNAHHTVKIQPSLIPLVDRVFNKTMIYFANNKPKDSGNFQCGTIIEKESCGINKKHNHFYITQYISLRMDDSHNIIPFLMLRYNFFNLS
jgi:hypothetical protein